jgi:ribosomal protein S27E
MGQQDKYLHKYVRSEFEAYLKCGRLEYGFLRVRCEDCHHEHLVAFSWPLLRIYSPAAFVHPARHHAEDFSRGLPDRAAMRGEWQKTRRMAESAALLVDDVLPHEPIRQWVLCIAHLLHINIQPEHLITSKPITFWLKKLLSGQLNVIAQLLLLFVCPVGVFNRYFFIFDGENNYANGTYFNA